MELYNIEDSSINLLWACWVEEYRLRLVMNTYGVVWVEDWDGICEDYEIRTFSYLNTHLFTLGLLPPLF